MPKETIWYYLVLLLFLGTSTLFGQPAGRPGCGFNEWHDYYLSNDVGYRQRYLDLESKLQKKARERISSERVAPRDEEAILTIPVVVHIFYPPGTPEGNASRPSPSQVQRAIQELNNGFRKRGPYAGGPYYSNAGVPGVDTHIEFRLAGKTPAGQPSNGLIFTATPLAGQPIDARVNGVEALDSLRRLSNWPSDRYLNIYVLPKLCDRAGDCPAGFAYQAAAHGRDFDGVYLFSQAMAGEVEVLIHEAGHYLNLYHTFEGNCSETDCLTGGDRVCDTPPDCNLPACSPSIGNCLMEQRQNTCHNDAQIAHSPFEQDVEDLYENFMDYGYWKCFNSFTPGQRERMRDALQDIRSSLLATTSIQPSDTCRIDSIALLAADSCRVPGAESWGHVLLYLSNAPQGDTLLVNGRAITTYESPVFARVPAPEGDRPLSVEAYFRNTPTCRLTSPALLTVPWCNISLDQRIQNAIPLSVSRAGSCREEEARWLTPSSTLHPLPDWAAPCATYAGGEHWLRLLVPQTGEITLRVQAEDPAARPALAVFTTPDNALLGCRPSSIDGTITYTLTEMPPGDSLAVAVWLPPGEPLSTLRICAYLSTPPPVNDQCRGALPLPLSDERYGQTCTATIPVDWTGALHDGPYSCETDEQAGPDVWFYALVPPNGRVSIQPVGAGAGATGLTVYRGCDTPPLACGQMSERGRPEIHLTDQPTGDTVFIRLWSKTPGAGAVRLCATHPPMPAPNDDCAQAIPLPVAPRRESAGTLLISNVVATASGRRNSCENDTADDLWYRIVAPPQGAVVVEVRSALGVVSPSLAAYSGCQGQEIACANTTGDQASFMLENLTPGDTLLLALWDFFGFRYGSAELVAYVPEPPVNDQCSSAFLLPLSYDSTQARIVLRKLWQATPSAFQPPCRSDSATADLWYELKAPAGGKLLLEVPPAAATGGLALLRGCEGEVLACLRPGERQVLSGLAPGERLRLVVWSASDSLSLRLFAPPDCPALLITGQSPSCAGTADGSVSIVTTTATATFSLRWNTGDSQMALRNLPAGSYRVTVTGAYQCRDTLSINLEQPPPLRGKLEVTPLRPEGNTGSILATGQGGTPPYTYRLDEGPSQSSGDFEYLPPGQHRVTIVDARGCSWSEIVEIHPLTTAAGPPVATWTSLAVFPSPTSGVLQAEITLRRSLPIRAALIDPLGRTVQRADSPAAIRHHLQWNMDGLPSGVYLLQLKTGAEVVIRRVVKVE